MTEKQRSSGVQELIDRLREKGVEEGKEQADQLVADARQQAAQMLDDARREAADLLQRAREEAERLRAALSGDQKESSYRVQAATGHGRTRPVLPGGDETAAPRDPVLRRNLFQRAGSRRLPQESIPSVRTRRRSRRVFSV